MRELRTSILISASPDRVWDRLMDFNDYPKWNPHIASITGVANVGNKITVRLTPPGMKPTTFRPRIMKMQRPEIFSWKGHLLFPGLFDGEHIFEIQPAENGKSLFIQRENFGGILVPFLWKMIDTKIRKGFDGMNEALKNTCEIDN